jgi:hypothetical protein
VIFKKSLSIKLNGWPEHIGRQSCMTGTPGNEQRTCQRLVGQLVF